MNQCTDDSIKQAYASLNADQKRVVDRVVEQVTQGSEPIRLFVSGHGGTGKSRVIHVLEKMVSTQYGNAISLPVAAAAPTGLTAFNVSGSTIHRPLCLNVEHGKPPDYSPLTADLKLLIIN